MLAAHKAQEKGLISGEGNNVEDNILGEPVPTYSEIVQAMSVVARGGFGLIWISDAVSKVLGTDNDTNYQLLLLYTVRNIPTSYNFYQCFLSIFRTILKVHTLS